MSTPPAAHDLLASLRRDGVRVEAVGDRLRFAAPRGSVEPAIRDALRSHKAELLQQLGIEAHLLGLSLHEFAQQDHSIELAVPWLDETIWFVPRTEYIDDLVCDGIHRGRIWTTDELKDLLSLPGRTEQDLVSLSRLKLQFDGEVVSAVDEAST